MLVALPLLFCSLVSGTPQIRYIDDTLGDSATGLMPQYLPPSQWSEGPKCVGCKLHPNPSSARNGTWRDTTWLPRSLGNDGPPSLQLIFTGISFTVYCIIPPSSAQAIINYDLKFNLDGNSAGNFTFDPNSTDYQYDFPVFTQDKLSNAKHNFTMIADSPTTDSVILFDYATYVSDDSLPIVSSSDGIVTPTSSEFPTHSVESGPRTPTNVSIIAGGIVGGVALIAIVAIAFLCIRRRRKTLSTMEPFVSPHDYSQPTTEGYVERVRIPLHSTKVSSEANTMSPSAPSNSMFSVGTLPSIAGPSSVYREEKSPPPAYESLEPRPL
ncbi:hypothetical protein PQX77_003951 [Marasmius sp. AFHP31]|nr:hypothetical protein PQX77_003951 [Marasmius sp. AFHP31]